MQPELADCDDVSLLFAYRGQRTLTDREEASLHDHLASCDQCRRLADNDDANWRWVVRVPMEALGDRVLDDLPVVDPVVFDQREEIGVGGMGTVLRVIDRRLGREVAIKESRDPDLHARFEREVRITARLQHPSIVSIYEAGTFPDGVSFYAMRLVAGRSLDSAIAQATTMHERISLLRHLHAAAEAVGYAHARGVVHRDLKPANILIGDHGETVVIDWGLAKEIGQVDARGVRTPGPVEASLTLHGSILGTPCFLSPAQAEGEEVEALDDVYALGAILYTILAGTPPYWDSTERAPEALVAATRSQPPTSIAKLAPEAPADLHAIVERAMARDPAQRFPTAKELADEITRFDAGQLLVSRDYSLREILSRWLRRHRRLAITASVAVVAAIAVIVLGVRYARAAEELALRERGSKLVELYSDVARQAARIERDLLRLEAGLEGLSAAAAWALSGPAPSEADVYLTEHFADPDRDPPDVTKGGYRWPVSVEYPVVAVAPGTDMASVMPAIRRLAPLREQIRQMVLQTIVPETNGLDRAAANALLLSRKSPIDYAYVDLPTGVHVVWPGMANLRRDYDVRTASFYQQSIDKRRTRWGNPYIDSTTDRNGDDLVLPCTKGVWSTDGRFLGVAGVEITVTKLVTSSMVLAARSTLRTSLVDELGRTVVDSNDANRRFFSDGRDRALELEDYDIPEVAWAIRDHQEGEREVERDGRAIVVAFVRLDAVGWYYVVEVEAASLGS